jgi:hypothetical protein
VNGINPPIKMDELFLKKMLGILFMLKRSEKSRGGNRFLPPSVQYHKCSVE